MNCDELRQNIEAYLAGSLTFDISCCVEEHLDSCPACAELLLRDDPDLDNLLASDWYLCVSPDLTKGVMRQLSGGSLPVWVWLCLGISVCMALWLGGAVLLLFSPKLALLLDMVSYLLLVGRSLALVIRLTFSALGFFQISALGLALTFGLAAGIVASMGVLSKEELA